jgi:hypothetical protein
MAFFKQWDGGDVCSSSLQVDRWLRGRWVAKYGDRWLGRERGWLSKKMGG